MSNLDKQCPYCYLYGGEHSIDCFGKATAQQIFTKPAPTGPTICVECEVRSRRIAALEADLARVREQHNALTNTYIDLTHGRDTLRAALTQAVESGLEFVRMTNPFIERDENDVQSARLRQEKALAHAQEVLHGRE